MKKIQTTDSMLIGIAIGEENGKWYVQTTDLLSDTHLSETIEEDLECKEHAVAIAMLYVKKYQLKFFDWSL